MDKVILFEEYRFIEKRQNDVHGAWKGIHLLLFFLVFVFGSFCTFCFHMLMYMFEDKCVLYPKLLSLNLPKHHSFYEFLPNDESKIEFLPVDFVSTQWLEESSCYLPTFVPLISGIFGLVWTTMFLMCSTGSSQLTGLQRPWRVLIPIFVFSVAMASLCVYTSYVTHDGLNALCTKLAEITGSKQCTYTINVATLLYERRVRGVYQAIKLTIMAAWLHTSCWIMSALVIIVRIFLAVDFHLIKITAAFHGKTSLITGEKEKSVRTVSPILVHRDHQEEDANNKDYQEYGDSKVKTLHINKKTSFFNGKYSDDVSQAEFSDQDKNQKSLDVVPGTSKENKQPETTTTTTTTSPKSILPKDTENFIKSIIVYKDLVHKLKNDDSFDDLHITPSYIEDLNEFKRDHQEDLQKIKDMSDTALMEAINHIISVEIEKELIKDAKSKADDAFEYKDAETSTSHDKTKQTDKTNLNHAGSQTENSKNSVIIKDEVETLDKATEVEDKTKPKADKKTQTYKKPKQE